MASVKRCQKIAALVDRNLSAIRHTVCYRTVLFYMVLRLTDGMPRRCRTTHIVGRGPQGSAGHLTYHLTCHLT